MTIGGETKEEAMIGGLVCNPAETIAEAEQRGTGEELFGVSHQEQIAIFNSYQRRIGEVRDGKPGIFFPSLIDLNAVITFQTKSNHRLVIIDVGGSYLKIATVHFRHVGKSLDCSVKATRVEYKSTTTELLEDWRWEDWTADVIKNNKHVQDILRSNGDTAEEVEYAALTFSYPLEQYALSNARVTAVHKQWKFIKDAKLYEEDITEALNRALAARGVPFCVNCVLNDATATYMAGMINNRSLDKIGVIVGTGTNGSFAMDIKGKSQLMNNEWAQATIPSSIVTLADQRVMDKMSAASQTYQPLEVLTAGYKFVDIIQESLRISRPCDEELIAALSLSRIIAIISAGADTLTIFEQAVRTSALSFKRRSAKILAAILLAIADYRNAKVVPLIWNGSVAMQDLDHAFLVAEIESLKLLLNKQDIVFEHVRESDASLMGAAFTALVVGDKQI